MRLQEVYYICKTALENWVDPIFTEHKRQNTNGLFYNLENFDEVKFVLDILSPTDHFSSAIHEIIDSVPGYGDTSPVYSLLAGKYSFDTKTRNRFQGSINNLKLQVQTVVDVLHTTYNDDNIGFDVKLPSNLSLSDMGHCIKDLDKVLSQCPLFWLESTRAELSSVDRGSIWINIAVIGTLAAEFLDRLVVLVDKVLMLRSHCITNKEQLQHYKQLKMQTDMLEKVTTVFDKAIDLELQTVTDELSNQYNINNPEDQGRLAEATKTLLDLSMKGLEIYKAIGEGNKDVKAVFPPLEQQRLSESDIKMLQEANDPTAETE